MSGPVSVRGSKCVIGVVISTVLRRVLFTAVGMALLMTVRLSKLLMVTSVLAAAQTLNR
jgi:hypothetical protein